MVSTGLVFASVFFIILGFFHNLQRQLSSHINLTRSYETSLTLDDALRDEIAMWLSHLRFWNGRSIVPAVQDVGSF